MRFNKKHVVQRKIGWVTLPTCASVRLQLPAAATPEQDLEHKPETHSTNGIVPP
jgi:hypothetical protein